MDLQKARDNARRLSRVPTQRAVQRANLECRAAKEAIRKFDERWAPDRLVRDLIRNERAELVRAQQKQCAEARSLAQWRHAGLGATMGLKAAQTRYEAARRWMVDEVADVSEGIPTALISSILKWAALALAAVLALPLLIRMLFYFVLAPLAERRPAIRLPLTRTMNTPIPLPGRSQTSISVTLAVRRGTPGPARISTNNVGNGTEADTLAVGLASPIIQHRKRDDVPDADRRRGLKDDGFCRA